MAFLALALLALPQAGGVLPPELARLHAQAVRADILPSGCFCSFECQSSCNTAYNPIELSKSVVDLVRMKVGLMSNHFEGDISDKIPVDTRLLYKDEKGVFKKTDQR